jgi:hypothetical protein
MKDLTEGKLQETLEFAKTINDNSLQECLNRLEQVEKNMQERMPGMETQIATDWAKHSFYFVRKDSKGAFCGNGGIIFHGSPNEGYLQGGSVQLEPSYGWQIHT